VDKETVTVMKISWTKHQSNQEVLDQDVEDENRSLIFDKIGWIMF